MSKVIGREEALRMANMCTWCGFCESVCPTYIITGEKTMGPRGRTWLTRAFLRGELNGIDQLFVKSIYSCITCKACITACPAGIDVPMLMSHIRDTLVRMLVS